MAVLDRVREPEQPQASAQSTTFEKYAETWLAGRTVGDLTLAELMGRLGHSSRGGCAAAGLRS